MLLALQVATHCLILSLLSNAVLAAVVTQAPLKAFGSQTGVGGGGGVTVPPPPLLLLLLQDVEAIKILKIRINANWCTLVM